MRRERVEDLRKGKAKRDFRKEEQKDGAERKQELKSLCGEHRKMLIPAMLSTSGRILRDRAGLLQLLSRGSRQGPRLTAWANLEIRALILQP